MSTLAEIAQKIGNQQETLERSESHLSNLSARVEEYVRSQNSLQSLENRAEASGRGISPIQGDVSTTPAAGGGVGGFLKGLLPAGLAGGISGLLAGGGVLAGIVGLIAVGALDSQKVKDNVETLLSIGDRYSENALSQLATDGAVVLALTGLGLGLTKFAIGGALNAGVEYFAGDSWADTVKTNVTTLLSIGDDYTAAGLGLLFDAGPVALALGGLGLGLAAFGVGQSITALGQWVTDDKWAKSIKDSVTTLLSIKDELGGNWNLLTGSVAFVPAMTGIATGLAIFSAGSTVAGMSDALVNFSGGSEWATNIKNNVVTLLGIKDELGDNVSMLYDSGAFGLAMSGIGLGLAAFGTGALLAGGTDMLADWFSTGNNWAQQVVDNVTTLLGIVNLPGIGADTAKFAATMTGIGAGLIAFSAGAGAASVSDAIADWITEGEGRQSWSQQVKDNVTNLLSIVDDADEGKATSFVAAMGQISAGLVAFSGANFVGSLTTAGAAIIGFFTGTESPFSQIKMVAEQAEELEKGAAAVDSLTGSIEKLGQLQFDGSSINMREFAEDLAASVPVIEKAIMGGIIEKFGPFNDIEFKGLASPDINYDDAISNITALRSALGVTAVPTSAIGNGILSEAPPASQPAIIPVPVPQAAPAPAGNGNGGGAYLLPAAPTVDPFEGVN